VFDAWKLVIFGCRLTEDGDSGVQWPNVLIPKILRQLFGFLFGVDCQRVTARKSRGKCPGPSRIDLMFDGDRPVEAISFAVDENPCECRS
jgi:hypothetical protein